MKKRKKPTHYIPSTTRQAEMPFAARAGMVVAIIFLCALLLVCVVGKSMAVVTVLLPPGPGSLNHPKGWCGQQGQPACRISPGWLPVTSEQPDEIAQVMMRCPAYAMLQKHAGHITVDTPALIHSLDAHTGIAYYDDDHWVASVLSTTRTRVGLFDFAYDSTHKHIRFVSFGVITPGDPRAHMAFPYVTATLALTKLRSQPGVHLLISSKPELVFFPLDPRYHDLRSNKYRWNGGGDSPMNPIWHVIGNAGNDYFVGTDLQTYTRSTIEPLLLP